jgi:hypothetical protein
LHRVLEHKIATKGGNEFVIPLPQYVVKYVSMDFRKTKLLIGILVIAVVAIGAYAYSHRSTSEAKYEYPRVGNGYTIEDGKAYYYGAPIAPIDISTFTAGVALCVTCAKDKDHLIVSGRVFPEIDLNTVLGVGAYYGGYFTDKYKTYFIHFEYPENNFYSVSEVATADRNTFEKISCSYPKDKFNVYDPESSPQEISTATTTQRYPDCYGQDKDFVYFNDQKILIADRQTFQILDDDGNARDKNYFYYNGQVIRVIPQVVPSVSAQPDFSELYSQLILLNEALHDFKVQLMTLSK